MTDLNQIEAGDELTMDIEGEMDGVADKEITVEVVEVQDAGYIVEADGQELGRLKTTTIGCSRRRKSPHSCWCLDRAMLRR